MAGPKISLAKGWELACKGIRMEDPTPVGLYLGCYHRIIDIVPPPLPEPYCDENLTELIDPEALALEGEDTPPHERQWGYAPRGRRCQCFGDRICWEKEGEVHGL